MRSAVMPQDVLRVQPAMGDGLVLAIVGSLDSSTAGQAWRTAFRALQQVNPRSVIVDAANLTYCDGAGAALLLELQRRQSARRGTCEIRSLPPAYQALLDLYERSDSERPESGARSVSPIEQLGRGV